MNDTTLATTSPDGAQIVANANTLNDAFAAFTAAGVTILDTSDLLGDEFGDIIKKDALLGRAFLIVDVKFHDGEFGPFAAVLCIDDAGKRFVFTDGSTGVYQQLLDLDKQLDDRGLAGLACRKGLRASEYEKDGRKAVTYYLA
jgi:hypothetical protein